MSDWKEWGKTLDNREAIYLQIVDHFKRSIAKKELGLGERMPSIRELASAMKVNPNTVNRAYQEMEQEGIIYQQRGMGYYVVEDVEKLMTMKEQMAMQAIDRFVLDMRAMGFDDEQLMAALQKSLQMGKQEESKNG